jgi:hypothetical protein
MKIVIQITFFLFILITTVICKVDCYASNKEKDLSGDIIRLKQDKYSSSFSTGKKDRFCKNNHPSGQFYYRGLPAAAGSLPEAADLCRLGTVSAGSFRGSLCGYSGFRNCSGN